MNDDDANKPPETQFSFATLENKARKSQLSIVKQAKPSTKMDEKILEIQNHDIDLQIENFLEQSSEQIVKFYDAKYQRKYYDVIIEGDGIKEFSDIYARVKEIERCVQVSPIMVLPIKSKISDQQ